jgi:hypothetical protein
MSRRLTAEQIRESIELADDDSASDFDDLIELRCLTEDEEEKDAENNDDDEANFLIPIIPPLSTNSTSTNSNTDPDEIFEFILANTSCEINNSSSPIATYSNVTRITRSETVDMIEELSNNSPSKIILG